MAALQKYTSCATAPTPLQSTENEEIAQRDDARQRVQRKERGAHHPPPVRLLQTCPALSREVEPAPPVGDDDAQHSPYIQDLYDWIQKKYAIQQ
eukprot:9319345-Pyramimonas_sp.AAC.1